MKEAIDKSTARTLIIYTALCARISKNVQKIIDRYKQMCGYYMCYYLLHASITKSLSVGASKPIEITIRAKGGQIPQRSSV